MKHNFTSFSLDFPCLFPIVELSDRIEIDDGLFENPDEELSLNQGGRTKRFAKFDHRIAVAESNLLAIIDVTEATETVELEFDHHIDLLEWDLTGTCLVVGDCQGIIHLVNQSGVLVFSKKIGVTIRQLSFFHELEEQQALYAVLKDGSLLTIYNFDWDKVGVLTESEVSEVPLLLKQAKFVTSHLNDDLLSSARDFKLFLHPQPYILVMEENGVLSAHFFSSIEGKVIHKIDFFVGESSQLSIVKPLIHEDHRILTQLVLHKLTSDGKIIVSFITLTAMKSMDGVISGFMLPHGYDEAVVQVEQLFAPASTRNHAVLGLKGNQILVYTFTSESQLFSNALEYQNPPILTEVEASTSFDQFLRNITAFFFQRFSQDRNEEINVQNAPLVQWLSVILQRSFPYELTVSLGLLMDICGLELTTEQLQGGLTKAKNTLLGSSSSLNQIGLSQAQSIVNQWLHYFSIAKKFNQSFSLEENKLGEVLSAIFPMELQSFLSKLLVEGKISELLFLFHRHFSFDSPSKFVQLLTEVPVDAPIQNLTQLSIEYLEQEKKVRVISIPRGGRATDHETVCNEFASIVLAIVEELLSRYEDQCMQGKLCIDENVLPYCQQLTKLLKMIDISEPALHDQMKTILSQLTRLEECLKIIYLSKVILHISCSLEEVQESGLEGMIFGCLQRWSLKDLPEFITTAMKEFLGHFHLSTDKLLIAWIKASVQEYLITSAPTISEDDQEAEAEREAADQEERCQTLLRIAIALNGVQDDLASTTLLLQLLNVPSIEKLCVQLNEDISRDLGASLTSSSPALLSRQLLAIGHRLSEKIDGPIYDKLCEAIRLFRMKCISLRYHIYAFDLKDRDHLNFVISIILNAEKIGDIGSRIEDALTFAIDDNSIRVDCQAAVTRILIHFIQQTNFLSGEDDASCQQILEKIPKFLLTTVLEDVITFIIDEINDQCDSNELFLDELEALEVEESPELRETILQQKKTLLQRYCKGCVKVMEYYDDLVTRNMTSSSALTNGPTMKEAATADEASIQSQVKSLTYTKTNKMKCSASRSSVLSNPKLLQWFKNLSHLQVSFQVYMNLENLKSSNDCKKLIESLAQSVITKWKTQQQSLSETGKTAYRYGDGLATKGGDTSSEWDLQALIADCYPLKKICSIVGGSCQIYIFYIAKQLIGMGRKMQALEFLQMNVDDLLSNVSSTNSEASSINSSNPLHSHSPSSSYTHPSGSGHTALSEWNMMVDGANLLCYTALKNERSTKSYGYYSQGSAAGSGKVNEKLFEMTAYRLSQFLLKHSILHCDLTVFARALDALTLTDTVLTVYERIEKDLSLPSSTTDHTDNTKPESTTVRMTGLGDPFFNKDGLLMSEDAIRGVLSDYCIQEMKRREISYETSSSSSLKEKTVKSKSAKQPSIISSSDVEALIATLQKFENHLTAMQILFRSWSSGTMKITLLRSSLTSLCRKILTYHNIDTSFAVACLAALPIDIIVKELKAAVPTIQSDFSRLHTVAMIGEEIAYLCDQESLLLLFQSLQTNAKWWYLLSNLGITIDLKQFQHTEDNIRETYIESLIPEILKKNAYQLDLLIDYGQSFELSSEKLCLAYIEFLFLDDETLPMMVTSSATSSSISASTATVWSASTTATPSSSSSSHFMFSADWIIKLKNMMKGIEEKQLARHLQKLLFRINPFHYEKIQFLCLWLLEITLTAEQAPDSEEGERGGLTKLTNPRGEDEGLLLEELEKSVLVELNTTVTSVMSNNTSHLSGVSTSSRYTQSLTYWSIHYEAIPEIIQLMNSIHFPAAIIQKIRKVPIVEKLFQRYLPSSSTSSSSSMSNIHHRFPLWLLLTHPYQLLEPILDEVMTIFQPEKLSRLLQYLQLNPEEFTIRSIFAYYVTLRQQPLYQSSPAEKIFELIQQTIREKLEGKSILYQIKVWECIYEREVMRSETKPLAMKALENILGLFQQERKYLSSLTSSAHPSTTGTATNVTGEVNHTSSFSGLQPIFEEKLRMLQMECIFLRLLQSLPLQQQQQLLHSTLHSKGMVGRSLSTATNTMETSVLKGGEEEEEKKEQEIPWIHLYLQYPKEMLKNLLGVIIEYYWKEEVINSHAGASTTTTEIIDAILSYSFNRSILSHVEEHAVINDLVKLAQLSQPYTSEEREEDGIALLQLVTIQLINHYLTESHLSSSQGTATSSTASSVVTGGGNHVNTFFETASQSFLQTKAEHRRQEDFFLAFAINVLTLLTGKREELRYQTIEYLNTIVRQIGTKTMRRFTTRSRLRASIALFFLSTCAPDASTATGLSTTFSAREEAVLRQEDIFHYIAYYYLMAEVQEIRLSTTTEEVILNCLAFEMIGEETREDGKPSSSDSTRPPSHIRCLANTTTTTKIRFDHMKSVLFTWMRDEGANVDVMELCCDLLHLYLFYQQQQLLHSYRSQSLSQSTSGNDLYDFGLVEKMMQVMIQQRHDRVLYRFIVLLSTRYSRIFDRIVYQQEMNRILEESLQAMKSAVDEKLQQVKPGLEKKEILIFPTMQHLSHLLEELKTVRAEHKDGEDQQDKTMHGFTEDDKENLTSNRIVSNRPFSSTTNTENSQKDGMTQSNVYRQLSTKEMALLKPLFTPDFSLLFHAASSSASLRNHCLQIDQLLESLSIQV